MRVVILILNLFSILWAFSISANAPAQGALEDFFRCKEQLDPDRWDGGHFDKSVTIFSQRGGNKGFYVFTRDGAWFYPIPKTPFRAGYVTSNGSRYATDYRMILSPPGAPPLYVSAYTFNGTRFGYSISEKKESNYLLADGTDALDNQSKEAFGENLGSSVSRVVNKYIADSFNYDEDENPISGPSYDKAKADRASKYIQACLSVQEPKMHETIKESENALKENIDRASQNSRGTVPSAPGNVSASSVIK